jgi:hypothetical protein
LTHPSQRENQEQYLSKMETTTDKLNNLISEFDHEKKEYLSSLPSSSSISSVAGDKERGRGGNINDSLKSNVISTTERIKSAFR